jgi:transglutaminase-like putative cysteine protease
VTDSTPESGGPIWSLVQPDSSIVALAAKLVGREQRPEAMARNLTSWVHRSITLREGAGTAGAAHTLRTRRGNEAERALLLVALARGAGLVSRPVWGLVLTDGRWQVRSWTEVWTETWQPFDPSAGERRSDAGRIRLATGGVGRFLGLATRAGRLRLEVLEETR